MGKDDQNREFTSRDVNINTRYQLLLLGPVQLIENEHLLKQFRSRKALGLLAYLSQQPEPVMRSHLAQMFWLDHEEVRGLRNLSRELASLTSLLPGCFESDPQTVQFTPAGRVMLDVLRFNDLTQQVAALPAENQAETSPVDLEQLGQAIALYRGVFMAGFRLRDCPDFDGWLGAQRTKWLNLTISILSTLAVGLIAVKNFDKAQHFARRWLELEPWREEAHQYLMLSLACSGQRSAALNQFGACKEILADELDIEPSAATVALYQEIRAGALPVDAFVPSPPLTGPLPENPYRGLSAFRQVDAANFFGREALVEQLVAAVARQPLTAVVGASGSGKSSVVLAGLLPRLCRPRSGVNESGADDWHMAIMRPGHQPFRALAEVLQPLLPQPGADVPALADRLVKESSLAAVAAEIIDDTPQKQFLLVIDQFEELYTLCTEPKIRQRFVDILIEVSERGTANVDQPLIRPELALLRLVLILRADFMSEAPAYRPLADPLQTAAIMTGPMTEAELRQVIEKPAQKQGVAFEPGLVDRILDDVAQAPGQLPLLQFALTTLWQHQTNHGRSLTHAAYEAIGRVQGALAHYAEVVYAQLNQAEQGQIRQILLQMVQPGAVDTRRAATRAELGETGWAMAQDMANRRLVVTGQNGDGQQTAEIAHEALIEHWQRLQEWLRQDRVFRIWQERLRAALSQWEATGQDEAALLRGAALVEAENRLVERDADINQAERDFIASSVALRERRRQEGEAQRQRELQAAQRFAAEADARRQAEEKHAEEAEMRAQEQQLANRRLRWLALGLSVMLTVAVLLGVWAWQAQQAAEVAQSLNLATNAQLALNSNNTDLALALALAANQLDNSPLQARLTLAETAYAPGTRRLFEGHQGPVQSVAISPDGQSALSASADQTLRLWDLATGQTRRTFSGHTAAVNGVAISPDGQSALSASTDQTLRLWDLATGQTRRTFSGHTAAVNGVAISPDGQSALSASADQTLRLWDLATGQTRRAFSGHTAAVNSVAISPDGQTALSGAANGDVILWDLATGHIGYRLAGHQSTATSVGAEQGHAGPVWSLAFSAGGLTAYSASEDELITRWDLSGPEISLQRFRVQPSSGVFSLAVSPDGLTILSGLLDSRITRLNSTTGQTSLQLLGHSGRVLALAVHPSGHMALSGAADGTLRLWNLEHGAKVRHLAAIGSSVAGFVNLAAASMALDPSGQWGATGHWNGNISLWNYSTGQVRRTLAGHADMTLAGVLFTPDGKRVVSGSGDIFAQATDNTIRLWDVTTGRELKRLEGHTDKLWDIDLIADGRFVVSGSHDGTLRRWDLQTGQGDVLLNVSPQAVRSVAFSPNGQAILVGLGQGTSTNPNYDLRLIDAATGQELRRFSGHNEVVGDVAFDPTGETALSGAGDTNLILWDVATGQEIRRFSGHTGTVLAVAFSPDGSLVASASQNKTAIIWETATASQLRRFPDHGGAVVDLTFTPAGHTLLTAAAEDGIREWRIDETPSALLDWIAANRYMPQLTCPQRQQYHLDPACADVY